MPAEITAFSGSRSGPQFGRRNVRRKPTSVANEVVDDLIGRSEMEAGVRNILDVRREMKNDNVWVTFFSKVVYTWRRPLFGPFPDLSMAVLTNRRVIEAVQKTARDMDLEDEGTDKLAVVERRAAKIMDKMRASISSIFIKFTGWFLLKFLAINHRGILVHRGQMAALKKASEKGLPMIFLPRHRSHLDYVLLTFVLWNYDIRAPYVAAGDNMDIPFFSKLMRSLGGFFIRRRLDNGGNQKDLVYRAVLNTYMLELLKKGESLEFFLEGGRTRTGRAIIPKGGLLSIVVEACGEGIIHDAYIVPVTFSYEKLLEGSFSQEQMGQTKKKESFWGACQAIVRVLRGDYGNVRVDFAQPFSTQEFLQSAERFPPPALKRSASLSGDCSSGLNLSQHAVSVVCNGGVGDCQDSTRAVVRALADQTVYTSIQTQAAMSTHCLAFLLLTKFRQGGTLPALAQDLDWLKDQLYARNFDVGFCGSADNVILYAQGLLGGALVRHSVSEEGDVVLTPNLSLPEVFELSYHANTLTTSFALESILACAVVLEAGLKPSMWNLQHEITDTPTVIRENVLTTAQHICDLMHSEFVLVPPCRRLTDVLVDKVEDFISMEILQTEESQYERTVELADRQWADRLVKSLACDDEEENNIAGGYIEQQLLLVNLSVPDIRSKLRFQHSVVAPILESYLITAYYITQSLNVDMPEDDFMKKLGQFAQERARNKLIMHIESCCLVTLKNAVKTFQNLRILDTYKEAGLTMISLSDHFGVRERLNQYIEILKVCRS